MAGVQIRYRNNLIAQMSASGDKTLLTEGKYLDDDVTVTYTAPSGPSLGTKTITVNGTYNASSDGYDGYSQVTAAVPNTYSASDEGKVVENGTLVAQGGDSYTENGTYDTTKISSITINVSSGGSDRLPDFLSNSMTELIDDIGTITSICANGVRDRTALTKVRLKAVATIGGYAFNNCSNVETIVLPGFTGNLSGGREFQGCSKLEAIDLGGGGNIGFSGTANPPWLNCANFDTLIIRKTSGIMTLQPSAGTAATFNGTPFAASGTGGTLYVPQSLVNSYKTGTNWQTWFADNGSHNNQVLAIEGSAYEHYYADGSAIPS